MSTRLLTAMAFIFAVLLETTGTSAAEDYPTRPVTIVVPLAPGGPADFVARAMVAAMEKASSKSKEPTFIVENFGGGGGVVGTRRVANAKPDGYTLLFNGMGMSVDTALHANLGFDPLKDFAYIGLVSYNPLVMVARPNLPYTTFPAFLKYLNARGRAITFASSGPGSTSNLCATWFMLKTKTNITSVPYRGTAPAMTAVLGKQVDLLCDSVGTAAPHIKDGELRAIGVTSKSRSELLPKVPTLAEQGLDDFDVVNWTALYAPKGTPTPIVDYLSRLLRRAVVDPAFKMRLAAFSTVPMPPNRATPTALASYLKEQTDTWGSVIRQAGIKPR